MIQAVQRIVYLAPLRGRSYLSRRAAADAEAGAMLKRKYPSEKFDPECGGGYHWSSDERLVRVHKRLTRLLSKRAATQPAPAGKESPPTIRDFRKVAPLAAQGKEATE